MKYTLAIFDLDGTILNTLDDLADAVNYALEKSDYPKRTREEVRLFVGNGIRKLIERAVPENISENEINKVHSLFTEYYKEHCADKTREYDGITQLISKLREKNIKTAVVSNKADYAVKELCERYFDKMFDYYVGEREGIRKKPCPDSVNEVIKTLKNEKNQTVYIGDSDVDIKTAKNASIDCISVDWGFRNRAFLLENGAQTIVSTTDELFEMITK
jgi:phosphoglycolate phosphatase